MNRLLKKKTKPYANYNRHTYTESNRIRKIFHENGIQKNNTFERKCQ